MRLALAHLRRQPVMGALIRRYGPPRFRSTRNSFQALARAILFQQVSGSAARSIYRRLVSLYPGRDFPLPTQVAATAPEQLRSAGLSRQKAAYLVDLASRFAAGSLQPRRFSRLSDQQVIEELTQVKGIGTWTAQMYLMSTLRRPDVLPLGDLGIRKGLRLLHGLDESADLETMESLSEPWRPYRTAASWYLWRVADAGGI